MVFRNYNILLFKIMLFIFKIFGLSMFSIKLKQNSNNKRKEIFFVHSSYTLFYTLILMFLKVIGNIHVCNQLYLARYKKTVSLIYIVDVVEQISGTVVVCGILLFYCIYRNTTVNLVTKIYKLKLITDKFNESNKKNSIFVYLSLFTVSFLILAFILLISGILYYQTLIYLFSNLSRNLTIVLVLLQYSSIVLVLLRMIENINDVLYNLTNAVEFDNYIKIITYSGVLLNMKKLQLLSTIRDLHSAVLKIFNEVNVFYGPLVLFSICYLFICAVIYSYFLVYLIIEKKFFFSTVEYYHAFLYLKSFMLSLILLTQLVNKTLSEVSIGFSYYMKTLYFL